MSSLDRDKNTTYWRSLEAFEARLESDPKLRSFVENEFPEQAADLLDPLSRRRFIQLMGASMALAGVAGTAGCQRWEREEIVPLSRRPEDYVPGESRYFATALELGGVADGLLVESYDGRPIKVEGNPQHPFGTHATTTFAQASLLHLYDPDRSMTVRGKGGSEASWDDIEGLVRALGNGDGTGLRILAEGHGSPTLARLRGEFLARFPAARWYEYEPVSLINDNERLGLQMAQMVPEGVSGLRAVPQLDKARRIVALEADLFDLHPARLQLSAGYAKGRQPQALLEGSTPEAMNRLYAIEASFTTSGASADHRLPLPVSHMLPFLDALEAAFMTIGRLRNANVAPMPRLVDMGVEALQKLRTENNPAIAALSEKTLRFAAALAADLLDNIRQSVVVAGPHLPPEVHARVAYMNALLVANGNTVLYHALPEGDRPSQLQDIVALGQEMHAGQVDTLFILGGNPLYTAPADVDFAGGLQKVKTSVHLSEYHDETSAACTWHLPRTHYLESWGDTRSYDGTHTIVQPLIEPMWRDMQNRTAKSPIELVAMLLGRGNVDGQALVHETFARSAGGLGDAGWRQALHDGFVAGSAFAVTPPRPPRKVDTPAPAVVGANALEVVFRPSTHTFDGRFANNAWMQELPDFITKLTWDNAALINPNTATQLGVSNGELIELQVNGKSARVAVYTLPGQARGTISVALGHGRSRAGRVGGHMDEGVAPTGFDVYGLRVSTTPYVATGATVRGTGARYELATTQDHWNLDQIGRDGIEERLPMLVREATAEEYSRSPEVIAEREHQVDVPGFTPTQNGKSLWDEHDYDKRRGEESPQYRRADDLDGVTRYRHRWGMSIDLGKCTGCNACTIACQAENNIPVVGKTQVINNREMHWIRIDRYFGGPDLRDEPQIAYQPLPCQQCENAPCEQVCPVGATIHSDEGLNDMAYNRCVGTRYCLNNCPYRVRRFNFLEYRDRHDSVGGPLSDSRNAVRKLLFNPEVTVRSRGVMEKCTFCVQRIQKTKIRYKNQGQEQVPDGAVLTACQQVCPTDAIVFGDLNDKDSMVSKAHGEKRAYALLESFNTKPRNLYLGRIRNPNPYLG
jgi:MoCo/4Fe-4S cofactor protein with predicted Tat translocation signal